MAKRPDHDATAEVSTSQLVPDAAPRGRPPQAPIAPNDMSVWKQVVVGSADFAPPQPARRGRRRWLVAGALAALAAGSGAAVVLYKLGGDAAPEEGSAAPAKAAAVGSGSGSGSAAGSSDPSAGKPAAPAPAEAAVAAGSGAAPEVAAAAAAPALAPTWLEELAADLAHEPTWLEELGDGLTLALAAPADAKRPAAPVRRTAVAPAPRKPAVAPPKKPAVAPKRTK